LSSDKLIVTIIGNEIVKLTKISRALVDCEWYDLANVFTRPQEWSWRFEGDFVGILPSWMMSGQDR
jgi:hypothetical protein